VRAGAGDMAVVADRRSEIRNDDALDSGHDYLTLTVSDASSLTAVAPARQQPSSRAAIATITGCCDPAT
jgi:hypothetical protein